jgi:hypothetical protein
MHSHNLVSYFYVVGPRARSGLVAGARARGGSRLNCERTGPHGTKVRAEYVWLGRLVGLFSGAKMVDKNINHFIILISNSRPKYINNIK